MTLQTISCYCAAIVHVRVRTFGPLGYYSFGEIIMFVGPDDDNACGLTTMPLVYGEVCSYATMHTRRRQNPI